MGSELGLGLSNNEASVLSMIGGFCCYLVFFFLKKIKDLFFCVLSILRTLRWSRDDLLGKTVQNDGVHQGIVFMPINNLGKPQFYLEHQTWN
jgi:hypothetical protein